MSTECVARDQDGFGDALSSCGLEVEKAEAILRGVAGLKEACERTVLRHGRLLTLIRRTVVRGTERAIYRRDIFSNRIVCWMVVVLVKFFAC